MKFDQYQVVRLKGFKVQVAETADAFNRGQPRIDDVATIVGVYTKPPGYELECSDGAGVTQWLIAFAPDDVELELVK